MPITQPLNHSAAGDDSLTIGPIDDWPKDSRQPFFAIVDTFFHPDILGDLYSEQDHYPVLFARLLDDTPWQASSEKGPLLVQISSDSLAFKAFAQQAQTRPVGSLWQARPHIDFDAFTQWARARCHAYNEAGNPLLLRYYDPRQLGDFIQTLSPSQRQDFFADITQAWWQPHQQHLHQATFMAENMAVNSAANTETKNNTADANPHFILTQQQLDAMAQRKDT